MIRQALIERSLYIGQHSVGVCKVNITRVLLALAELRETENEIQPFHVDQIRQTSHDTAMIAMYERIHHVRAV
jgi:hypothetical protein